MGAFATRAPIYYRKGDGACTRMSLTLIILIPMLPFTVCGLLLMNQLVVNWCGSRAGVLDFSCAAASGAPLIGFLASCCRAIESILAVGGCIQQKDCLDKKATNGLTKRLHSAGSYW